MLGSEGNLRRRRRSLLTPLLQSVTIASGCICMCRCDDPLCLNSWLASSSARPLGSNPAIHRGHGALGSGHPPARREWKRRRRRLEKKMAMLWWTALKKSLSCKSRDSCDDVIKREDSRGASARGLKKSFLPPPSMLPRSGCSRSISNLRDVIHSQYGGGRRPRHCDSPRSIESSDVLNAATHDVLLAAAGGPPAASGRVDLRAGAGFAPGLAAWSIGGAAALSPLLTRCSTARLSQREVSPLRRSAGAAPAWVSSGVGVRCDRCGGRFSSDDALESHHLAYHAVTELVDGDTASKVVELIYRVGWPDPEAALDRIERVVKVHSMDKSVDRFKAYMEEVKARAARLPNKHPRCIADGNELLQFHGTTVSCSLGAGGSHSICASGTCNVCRIIRHGFSATRESNKDGVGVFTTSMSKRALECIGGITGGGEEAGTGTGGARHALIVCRAIAGRIHRPLENLRDVAGQPGFDSVAGQVGADSSIEELYLLNPSALLPCFVVICKA
ncbi:hypothetical protein SEVIR_4G271700v4 [Setaria viridis]|uniref:C2H2-type domain-containing protein n=1 Tax=Setaria viridis TaxID=4556 RepID=A0A4U6V216_SETVI|nr:uncharacterized protein LOC117852090 isoform X1 [Setaria viridis]TKW23101.1 hypothetical protein SEVIR_4G271700v2 [Setaria viridis]